MRHTICSIVVIIYLQHYEYHEVSDLHESAVMIFNDQSPGYV